VLQPDSLKIGSCKFNFIINIINITLRSGVAANPRFLGITLQKNPKFLNFYFFNIFYAKKITRGIARVSKLVNELNPKFSNKNEMELVG